jgi:hypothetical protein
MMLLYELDYSRTCKETIFQPKQARFVHLLSAPALHDPLRPGRLGVE